MKRYKRNKRNKKYETKIKIRGYSKQILIKQQQEKVNYDFSMCMPGVSLLEDCASPYPPVSLHEICKNSSKISRTPLIHGHFHIAAKFT